MDGSALDSGDFVTLIVRHERRIRAFIATLVGYDQTAIDDLMQSTYLVAWKKLPTFRYLADRPDEEAVRWIMTIARFETLNYVRQKHKFAMPAFSEALINEIADVQAADTDYFDARQKAFAGCIEKLTAQQRATIELRYGLNLSMTEIAARQNRPPNAVAAALVRLRKSLQRCISGVMRQQGYC